MGDTVPSLTRPYTLGVDLSRWQGEVDFSTFEKANIVFAVSKAAHASGADASFARNWRESKARGVIRGGYGWYLPQSSSKASAQADALWSSLEKGGYTETDMPPAMDFEEPFAMDPRKMLDGAFEYIERLIARSGRRPLLYTGTWFWNQYLKSLTGKGLKVANNLFVLDAPELVAMCDLWHSEYPPLKSKTDYAAAVQGLKAPTLPAPWQSRGLTAVLHQFDGDKGLVLPQGTDSDFNVFWGDREAFVAWVARSSDPQCIIRNWSAPA